MKKLISTLLFSFIITVGFSQKSYIGKSYKFVLDELMLNISTNYIDTGSFSDTHQRYIITHPETFKEKWYYFSNNKCVQTVYIEPSSKISVYVANFNNNKWVYDKKKDAWLDPVKKCYWSIVDKPNQTVQIICKKQ